MKMAMRLSEADAPWAIAEEYGNRLKQLRLSKNLRQIDIAKMSGLSCNAISEAEKGNIHIKDLLCILYALGELEYPESYLPKLPEVDTERERARPQVIKNEANIHVIYRGNSKSLKGNLKN